MWIGTTVLRRGAFGQPSIPFLLPEGRTYSPPRRGGGIACGNRALCEADAAVATAYGQCHTSAKLLSLSTQLTDALLYCICQQRAQTCHWQLCCSYGCVPHWNAPIFFLRKRNKNERTVRTSGNLPSGSEGHQSRRRTKRRCCRSIYELLADSK